MKLVEPRAKHWFEMNEREMLMEAQRLIFPLVENAAPRTLIALGWLVGFAFKSLPPRETSSDQAR